MTGIRLNIDRVPVWQDESEEFFSRRREFVGTQDQMARRKRWLGYS